MLPRHSILGPLRVAILIALVVGAGFVRSGSSWSHQVLAREADELRFGGCLRVENDNTCVLRSGERARLVLWVKPPEPQNPPYIEAGPERVDAAVQAVHGGWHLAFDVPVGAAAVVLRPFVGRGVWLRMRLHWEDGRRSSERAEAMRLAGQAVEAREILGEAATDPDDAPHRWSVLARLEREAGDASRSEALLAQAIARHRELGHTSAVVRDATALAHALTFRRRAFDEARALLAEARAAAGQFGPSRFFVHYTSGLLADAAGDLRSALAELRQAVVEAERLDDVGQAQMARLVLLGRLARVGQLEIVDRLLDRIAADLVRAPDPCTRGYLHLNRAWSCIERLEGGGDCAAPVDDCREAERAFQDDCKRYPDEVVNARINLAVSLLHAGRIDEAVQTVSLLSSSKEALEPRFRLWVAELSARVALARAPPSVAAQSFASAAEQASAWSDDEMHWRALTGWADALMRDGRDDDALDRLREAEQIARRGALQVALGDGRAAFLAGRNRATQLHVSLLLRRGNDREALAVVRRARRAAIEVVTSAQRARGWTGVERARWEEAVKAYQNERDELREDVEKAWGVPQEHSAIASQQRAERRSRLNERLDTLMALGGVSVDSVPRPAREGEAVVAFFPLGSRWVGFVELHGEVVARTLDAIPAAPDAAQLSTILLEPFRATLEKASTLRVLAWGALHAIDVHALPWNGAPLIVGHEVVYSLDAPHLDASVAATPTSRAALLVFDPSLNLPGASRESRRLQVQREPRFGELRRLVGLDASRGAVLQSLSGVDLFHFSGHGTFSGPDGLESHLVLAGDTRLGVGDVLTLADPPRWVALLGCDSGKSPPDVPLSLGLAQAFLLAGAEQVVAATRALDDEGAATLAAALYAQPLDAHGIRGALRRAQLELLQRGVADWAALRVFVP